MEISKVSIEDYAAVRAIFKAVKSDLAKQNNDQWKWIYPNRFTYKADIRNGTMYGIQEKKEFKAVVTLDNIQSDKYAGLNWKDTTGSIGCIHRLAVHPRHQGQGLGKKMLQFAENLARSQGCSSIRIDVYESNETAVSLYEKYGYEQVGLVKYPLRKLSYISMEKLL